MNFIKFKDINYQDQLKFIALISMIIDHIGLFIIEPQFYPIISHSWFRLIGRFAMPIFCFFAGYNYYYKKENSNFSFCLEVPRIRNIFVIGCLIESLEIVLTGEFNALNILTTIIVGVMVLDLIQFAKIPLYIAAYIFAFTWPVTVDYFDYGTLGFSFIIAGYIYRSCNFQSITILLAFLCYSHGMFNQAIFYFSPFQVYLSYFISMTVFLSLVADDFNRQVRFRFFGISRYILELYFVHYVVLFLIYINYFNY